MELSTLDQIRGFLTRRRIEIGDGLVKTLSLHDNENTLSASEMIDIAQTPRKTPSGIKTPRRDPPDHTEERQPPGRERSTSHAISRTTNNTSIVAFETGSMNRSTYKAARCVFRDHPTRPPVMLRQGSRCGRPAT